jgi:hypothetical protein
MTMMSTQSRNVLVAVDIYFSPSVVVVIFPFSCGGIFRQSFISEYEEDSQNEGRLKG